MGISASKRVEQSLRHRSPEFNTACETVFNECLELAEHAFPGIRPYQLLDASTKLYQTLSAVDPLIKKWVPCPPNQSQVDTALSTVTASESELDLEEFRDFALELFKQIIVSNAGKVFLEKVPLGVAGIAGIGIVTRSGGGLVGSVIGVYALGVATAVYLSLSV